MKRLAEHAPDLNIFSAKFILRDDAGWELTEQGRNFWPRSKLPLPFEDRSFDQSSIRRRASPPHRR